MWPELKTTPVEYGVDCLSVKEMGSSLPEVKWENKITVYGVSSLHWALCRVSPWHPQQHCWKGISCHVCFTGEIWRLGKMSHSVLGHSAKKWQS